MAIKTIATHIVTEEMREAYNDVWRHNDGSGNDWWHDAIIALLKAAPAVEPAPVGPEKPINQCDGCQAGMHCIDGLHYHNNKPVMACTKSLYIGKPAPVELKNDHEADFREYACRCKTLWAGLEWDNHVVEIAREAYLAGRKFVAAPVECEPVAWAYELATAMAEDDCYARWVSAVAFDKPNAPEGSIRNLTPLFKNSQRQKHSEFEPVAYGFPNSAITGKKQKLMCVRLEIPSDDQYGGALWLPLYLNPLDEETRAMVLELLTVLDYAMFEFADTEQKVRKLSNKIRERMGAA